MSFGLLLWKYTWGIPPSYRASWCLSQYNWLREKAWMNFIWTRHKTYSTLNFLSYMFSNVTRFVLPQILRLCWLTFPDKWNVGSVLKILLTKSLSSSCQVGAKCVVNFFVLGSCMLQWLVLITFKSQKFLHHFVHCQVWYV